MDDETVDELREYDLRITQPRLGYRFSLDPLLLARFADVGEGSRVVDLGTGCGVIPLVMARMSPFSSFVGIEFQERMAALARRNVTANGLDDRISIETTDVLGLRQRYTTAAFDLVTANPPFRRQGTGRVSPRPGRDAARHETTATLGDFIAASEWLAKPGGRICFVYHVSRLAEFLSEAEHRRLSAARLRFVHGTVGAEARMFLAELLKGRRTELRVLPPLIVHGAEGWDAVAE